MPLPTPPVAVTDDQQLHRVDLDEIAGVAAFALRAESCERGVEVALVDDATIAELHLRFLNVEGPTDVITFPLEEEGEPGSLGEIVVSVETALRQGPRHGLDSRHEILLYVIHGVLHLLGYDDGTEEEADRMDERQRAILEAWRAARDADDSCLA